MWLEYLADIKRNYILEMLLIIVLITIEKYLKKSCLKHRRMQANKRGVFSTVIINWL